MTLTVVGPGVVYAREKARQLFKEHLAEFDRLLHKGAYDKEIETALEDDRPLVIVLECKAIALKKP